MRPMWRRGADQVILRALFPRAIRRELATLATELHRSHPQFAPQDEPWHLTALVLVWLVREVCKLREVRT
jgi:hypothetical protein